MNEFLKGIASRLDLTTALKQAALSNDLLPPREDDRVAGELGKRFVAHLEKAIEEGRYQPDAAAFIQVPKPGFTSRPAALLTLTDRVVYEALVNLVRTRLGKYLISADVVFWPRESYVEKRWLEFEHAPLGGRHPYIVKADVSGFYDSIDHQQLEDLLVQATGEREACRAMREFLSRIMSSRRGIPQGLLPSDTLATTFLQPVDTALVRDGFDYWRHGDDIRIASANVSRAREAISSLEVLLREQGLLINGSKCGIVKRPAYSKELAASDGLMKATRTKLLAQKIKNLKSDQQQLDKAMQRAKLDDQWRWDLFYHQKVSVDQVIKLLRKHLEPDDVELAAQLFAETIDRAPGQAHALGAERFHQQIARSLLRLAAGRSPIAIKHAASIVARFPDKTELVAGYLLAMQKGHARRAVRQVENVLLSNVFTTPWQQAWLYRVLTRGVQHVGKKMLKVLSDVAKNEGASWFARVEAMKVLARAKKLDGELVVRSWKLAPRSYRSDLIAATAGSKPRPPWAQKFLLAAHQDPIAAVVTKHVMQTQKTPHDTTHESER